MDNNNQSTTMDKHYSLRILMFYIPLLYAIRSRFIRRTHIGVLFWMGEYLFPVLLSLFLADINSTSATGMLIAVVCVYCFYEVGYIQNDCETIKKEANPTLRLLPDELAYYERHKWSVYWVRILLSLAFTVYYLSESRGWEIITSLWLLFPYYYLYNTVRGRINDYLIVPLMIFRYCMPLWLYQADVDPCLYILVFIAYPFCTFIQLRARGKNGPAPRWTKLFLKDYSNRDQFRIKYYLFLMVLVAAACMIGVMPWAYMLLPGYYLVFRVGSLVLRRKGLG